MLVQWSLYSLNSVQQFIVRTAVALVLIDAAYQACRPAVLRVASVVTLLCAFCWQVVNGDATVGDFVTMNVYIVQVCLCIWWLHITIWLALTLHLGGLQLFQPLGFLGTIYGAIVDAIEDMRSLTELLGNVRCLPWWRRLATHMCVRR